MPMGCSVEVFEVPAVNQVGFVFLSLEDNSGNVVSRNEYVLAEKMDEHNWAKYRWWRTQVAEYADFSALNALAKADVAATMVRKGDSVEVTLSNESPVVAFFTDMKLKDAAGEMIVPAFWNDNFVSLAPGETRVLTCRATSIPADATVTVAGWNVSTETLK